MENIDKLVQLITDRLLEKLQVEDQASVYFRGHDKTKTTLLAEGFALVDDVALADYVVLDNLSVDAFLRLAALCPTTADESQVLTALLTGKKVLVSSDSLDLLSYKQTASSLLYRNLLKQKEVLEKYGLQFYQEEQLPLLLGKTKAEPAKPVVAKQTLVREKATPTGKRRLITETKLREMDLADGGTFKVEKGMIITALAKDYLSRHHITIVE